MFFFQVVPSACAVVDPSPLDRTFGGPRNVSRHPVAAVLRRRLSKWPGSPRRRPGRSSSSRALCRGRRAPRLDPARRARSTWRPSRPWNGPAARSRRRPACAVRNERSSSPDSNFFAEMFTPASRCAQRHRTLKAPVQCEGAGAATRRASRGRPPPSPRSRAAPRASRRGPAGPARRRGAYGRAPAASRRSAPSARGPRRDAAEGDASEARRRGSLGRGVERARSDVSMGCSGHARRGASSNAAAAEATRPETRRRGSEASRAAALPRRGPRPRTGSCASGPGGRAG